MWLPVAPCDGESLLTVEGEFDDVGFESEDSSTFKFCSEFNSKIQFETPPWRRFEGGCGLLAPVPRTRFGTFLTPGSVPFLRVCAVFG